MCLSVCLSICLVQVGVLLKRLNSGSCCQHRTIAQGVWFPSVKNLGKTEMGSPQMEVPNAGGVDENYGTETVQVTSLRRTLASSP